MKIVNVKGHDQAVISLLNGDVDAQQYSKMRTIVKKINQTCSKILKF